MYIFEPLGYSDSFYWGKPAKLIAPSSLENVGSIGVTNRDCVTNRRNESTFEMDNKYMCI